MAQEGDIDWAVIRLPGGRYAATDDAEVAPDRVAFFPSYDAAIRAQWDAWRLAYPDYTPEDATDRFGWRVAVPSD